MGYSTYSIIGCAPVRADVRTEIQGNELYRHWGITSWCKWYICDDDSVLELTSKFPDVKFVIIQIGEVEQEIFYSTFQNGVRTGGGMVETEHLVLKLRKISELYSEEEWENSLDQEDQDEFNIYRLQIARKFMSDLGYTEISDCWPDPEDI